MREWHVMSLVAALMEAPEGYQVVLEADDAVLVYEFRVQIDHDLQIVRLTSWDDIKEVPHA